MGLVVSGFVTWLAVVDHGLPLGSIAPSMSCGGLAGGLFYRWRHQLSALATAGFHAVAPDMRGYGKTDRPEVIDQYTLLHLIGDMVGLLDALGHETAVIAGHDWRAPVAWHAALLRPDRVRAVIGLSVPFVPRGPDYPSKSFPETDDTVFYQSYFQSPGIAEADLERDVRFTMRAGMRPLDSTRATAGSKRCDDSVYTAAITVC